jgi:hypothetical protein
MMEEGTLSIVRREQRYQVRYASNNPHGWAKCRGGGHDCPPSRVGERTQRSLSGPLVAFQANLTTVKRGATRMT